MKNFQEQINQFFTKTDKEILDYLLEWWEMDSASENGTIRLIGTYEKAEKPDKNGNEYGFFINVRSPKGDILYYPFRLGQVRVWVGHRESLNKEEFLQFEVKFSRRNERNPFELSLANNAFGKPKNTFLDRLEKEKFIKDLFSKRGATPDDARTIANALSKLAGDLYTDLTERFVFELLQNADDMPNEKNEVNVKFILLQENLLFVHNGKPFDQADIRAITDIGYSTKKKDPEQTGYKGIGFKVVFRESDNVLIKSGGYSFSFDKEHPFYNQLQSSLYEGLNIDEIPWQLKPIWAENYRYSREIKECEDFMKNSPVAIAIETNFQKIKLYKSQIKALFNEPRFSLFLRKIKTIEVLGLENPILIEKQKSSKGENYFVLNDNEWIINDFEFGVTPEIREGMANDKIVPEKLKEIQKSKLSFACQIKDSKIESISPDKSFLFTYLPTNVNDYKFPFLVNADFLTTANRQSIHVKNIWNLYLFEQIGFLSFKWISEIAQNEDLRFTITNLIPIKFSNLSKEEIENNNTIPARFNNGFDKAIKEIAFLPTSNGALCKAEDALVDLTGLSEIIGKELFIRVTNPSKTLIDNRLELKNKLIGLQGITIFGENELKNVFANENFQQALTTPLLLEVLKFLQKKNYNFFDIGLLQAEKNDGLFVPSSLHFQTNQADKSLLTFKAVYFLHPTINDYADCDIVFKNWLASLGVKIFDGANFIRNEVIGNYTEINKSLCNISQSINFWSFVYKNRNLLLETEIKRLSNFNVIDIRKKTCPIVSNCYLSDYYKEKGEPSTEGIFEELGLEGYFLMADYCPEQKNASDWRKFFNQIGLKRSDNIRIFKDKLLSFIQNGKMSTENYLKVTKFVFEVFNSNRDIFEGLNLSNFKVRTTNDFLKPITTCILSDDYIQDLRLSSVLPEQVLPNQIHSIYLEQISNKRQIWKDFFLRLNPNVELSSTDIIKRKISILASNPNLVTHQNVLQVWKTILSFKEDLLKTHKEELKKIPLLLKNNSLVVPTFCYFPKEYNPNTEIEELLMGFYDCFISPTFNSISELSYSDLKSFFKQLNVSESLRGIFNLSISEFHIKNLKDYEFAVRFWKYFAQNFNRIETTQKQLFLSQSLLIPCLDGTVKPPTEVHSYAIKDLVNDKSLTCSVEFSSDLESFLGLQTRITVSKCFQILNSIADSNSVNNKKIKLIYEDLLYRFSNESPNSYSSDIANFKQNGRLLSNKGTFQSVTSLFYQDTSANYLPLDESDKVVKRFGDKEYWKKFEVVLKQLDIQIITVSDFCLDAHTSKYDAIELNLTLSNSITEFSEKIDTINFLDVESQLKSKLTNLKIYYSPKLKLNCGLMNYSTIVPNYYDTSQNTIYYSGNWNSISNTKLIEYLFKALNILENQISKDEFVSILLKNIPIKEAPNEDNREEEQKKYDEETGRIGEEFVLNELKRKFNTNIQNTPLGFKSDEVEVIWERLRNDRERYDFTLIFKNNIITMEVKSTTWGENFGTDFSVSANEWKTLASKEVNYILARVFNARKNPYVKFIRLAGLQNLEEINL